MKIDPFGGIIIQLRVTRLGILFFGTSISKTGSCSSDAHSDSYPKTFSHIPAIADKYLLANSTIENLTNYQVIQRTSEGFADIPVYGTHVFSWGSHVQVWVGDQQTGEALKGFNWTKVDTAKTAISWRGAIHELPVGGEYCIKFRQVRSGIFAQEPFAVVEHILIGDLWGASGQSNMEGCGSVEGSDAPIDQVHVLTVAGGWKRAQEPLIGSRSGPALRFAQTIYAETGIPIGIVLHARGSTYLNYWMLGGEGYEKWMSIIDLAGGRLKGIIWYQGESEIVNKRENAISYKAMMKIFMEDIRTHCANDSLPWVIAQTASICNSDKDSFAVIVRESQRELALEDGKIVTITTIDQPRVDCFHFETPQYQVIGNRFAAAALKLVYGYKSQPLGPRFSQAWFADTIRNRINIACENVIGELGPAQRLSGFFVNDQGEIVYPDLIDRIASSLVMLKFSSSLSSDASVGFGYGLNPESLACSDETHIPLQPFYAQPIGFQENETASIEARNKGLQNAPAKRDLEIRITENPIRLYGMVSVYFSDVKSTSASFELFDLRGSVIHRTDLCQGQTHLMFSRRFLPAGNYVIRICDGKCAGTKKIFWKTIR